VCCRGCQFSVLKVIDTNNGEKKELKEKIRGWIKLDALHKRLAVGDATLMRAFNLTRRVTLVTSHIPLCFEPS